MIAMAGKGGDNEPPNNNIFIGDLPPDYSEEQLKEVFGTYGTIASCKLLPGAGKNAMLIRFQNLDEAISIKENLNGQVPNGLETPVYINYNNRASKGKGKDDWGKGKEKIGGFGGGYDPYSAGGKGKGGKEWIGMGPPAGKGGDGAAGGGGDPMAMMTAMMALLAGAAGGMGGGGDGGDGGWGADGGKGGKIGGKDGGKDGGKAKGGKGKFTIKGLKKGLEEAGVLTGGESSLLVKGLPNDTADLDLYHIFAPFGAIPAWGCTADVNADGTCKGSGTVCYVEQVSAQTAILTLNGAQMPDGSTLQVSMKAESGGEGGEAWW